MSAWPDNGVPPTPDGAGEAPSAGPMRSGGGIVPFGSQNDEKGSRDSVPLPLVLLTCAVGGAVASSTMSLAAPILVGYGLCVAHARGGMRLTALGTGISLASALALGLPVGLAQGVGSVIACLAGLIVALVCLRGRLTPGAGCLVVAALFAAHIGVDSAFALMNGTTLSQTMAELIEFYRDAFTEASPTSSAQVQTVSAVAGILWPTAYVVVSSGEFLAALAGAHLALRRVKPERSWEGIAGYDLPLWIVVALVVAIAGLAIALTVPTSPQPVLMVSANLAMALRIAFAVQGAAVVAWLLRGRDLGAFARFLVWAAALYLEVQFVVLTVVGVVDVWANFRHLQRGAAPDGTAAQDKKPGQTG